MLQGDVDDVVDPVRMACLLAGPAVEPLLIQARFILDSHSVVLFLRDPHDATVAHVAMGVGVPEDFVGRQLSSDEGLMGHVLQTGNAISVADRSQLPDAISHPLMGAVTGGLSVPVRLDGRVIGALSVGRDDPFAPSERHLLAPVADAIAQLLPPWLIGASWPAEVPV
jgi:GAF domain-containing protein